METIAKIRRAHYVQGKSVTTVARELGVSRKVVRKVLRSGETRFAYVREVQLRPKLRSLANLAACLAQLGRIDEPCLAQVPRRQAGVYH